MNEPRTIVAHKTCERCGHDSVFVEVPRDRPPLPDAIRDLDSCRCPSCDLRGAVVFHVATPANHDAEDLFDILWCLPETGVECRRCEQ